MDSQILELVQKSMGGDTLAFGTLYDLFSEKIFRFILFKVQNKTEAEDLLQEIFIKAWKSIKQFDPARGNFNSWLYAIASNTLNDYFRRVYRKPPTAELSEAEHVAANDNVQEKTLVADELSIMKKCLNRLPPQYQQVLELRFVQDLGVEETAQALQKNALSVRVLQHRALKQLRLIMQKERAEDT